MKKAKYLCLAVFAAAALAGCSSTSDSEGALPELYLRGTMNDYGVKPEFLLKQTGDEGLCADAKLSAGDGYTKFKFADAGWTLAPTTAMPTPACMKKAAPRSNSTRIRSLRICRSSPRRTASTASAW